MLLSGRRMYLCFYSFMVQQFSNTVYCDRKSTWRMLASCPPHFLVYLSYYSHSLFIVYRIRVDIHNLSSLAFAHSPANSVCAPCCLLGEHAVSNVERVSVQKTVSCCQEQHRWEPRAKNGPVTWKTFIKHTVGLARAAEPGDHHLLMRKYIPDMLQ